ncbi:MAG TPA: molybdopterin-dependent oxidoreductase, partial [Terriglobales bacterium]|nr:molybdopterin-dependent oxidoreductase [Terriglobales bacterium]
MAKYLDRVYSPDRVLYPMRRVAAKGAGCRGAGDFERISWDAAIGEIAMHFKSIAADFGSEAILPYSYGGTLAVLSGSSMDRRFFHRLGASQLERSICSAAGEAGLKSVTGVKLGTEPEQFRHSRYIIAWGANIHGNNVHLWPFIEEARRAGAKLVVIDPYRTRTAGCADWYLPINPGTDTALALSLMHVIIAEGLQDSEYIVRHTTGFEQLQAKVKDYPPERVERWTGIAAADIRKLAHEYATNKPAAIRVNYGVQRSENGGMAVRTVSMLPCITGSWKEVGGGLQLSLSGVWNLEREALDRPDLMLKVLGRPARVVNMVELGKALNTLTDPPVKALFVYNSNPAAVCPNHNEVIRGLQRPDLFTVVHEQFFTDTVDYADIVLPATTFFEQKDLQTSYGHHYLQMSDQAIEPLGECRPNVEVFRWLAKAMGFEDECFGDSVDEMIDQALSSENPWLLGIDRKRLETEGHIRLNFGGRGGSEPFLPFAEGFQTSSRKAELYNPRLGEQGLDPVAEFVPPKESRHEVGAGRFPLEMLARKADNFLNTTFTNLPSVQAMEDVGILEIHAQDAQRRGIGTGDAVRVFNGRGELRLRARVNGAVQPGVVAAALNWVKLSSDGANV